MGVLALLILVLGGVACNALADAATDGEVIEDEVSVPEPLDEAVSSSCLYDERLGAQRGELYRFCFEEDVLVDKTVVFPEEVVDDP